VVRDLPNKCEALSSNTGVAYKQTNKNTYLSAILIYTIKIVKSHQAHGNMVL
jgi:hypothetical protein